MKLEPKPNEHGEMLAFPIWVVIFRNYRGYFLALDEKVEDMPETAYRMLCFASEDSGIQYFEEGFAKCHTAAKHGYSKGSALFYTIYNPRIVKVDSHEQLMSWIVGSEGRPMVFSLKSVVAAPLVLQMNEVLARPAYNNDGKAPRLVPPTFGLSYTPWTDEQVELLKRRQSIKTMHEYTCGKCSGILTPTKDGLICPKDDYVQVWCHHADVVTENIENMEKYSLSFLADIQTALQPNENP